MIRVLTRFLIPVLLLGAAGAGALTLVKSAESAEKKPPEATTPLVETVVVKTSDRPAVISGAGVVEAERKVTLSAEVNGKLTKVSDSLVVGGRVKTGDFLAKIDATTYALVIRERHAQVEQARAELELEKGRGSVAEREWGLLSEGKPNQKRSALALREPQRKAAEVSLESASAALDRARHDQSRTQITAPFNATIVDESAEKGLYVAPGTPIATLIGTDAFRVRVSLPVEDLALISIPGLGGSEGSPAKVVQDLGDTRIERAGVVVRLIGELDPESRTAQVLVEVRDPLDPPAGELPLLPGAFVTVELEGRKTAKLAIVPREAVYDGDRTWVVTPKGTLESRRLRTTWSTPDALYVSLVGPGALAEGDRLMTTDLPVVAEGMQVRVAEETHNGE